MTDFILHFDQVKESHRDRSGGKGCALARLCQAEFSVPQGFVVTVDAYRAFVAINNLDAFIADALADGSPAMASAFIWAVLEETEIPPSITTAICDSYLVLRDGKVAVRSSALSEDSAAASFAGQHETFLGIAGCDLLLAVVHQPINWLLLVAFLFWRLVLGQADWLWPWRAVRDWWHRQRRPEVGP